MSTIMQGKNVGFIGTGHMARALARGFLQTQTIVVESLFGYDINPDAVKRFAEQTGGHPAASIKELVIASDVVFLSVKPQQMAEVLHQLGSLRAHGFNPLWVTIAPGISIGTYLKEIGNTARLVRVMPNTPCLVGEGVSGFCISEGVTPNDVKLISEFLATVGVAIQFPERQLDAVAGLSGSGPAYIYILIEALADGGVKMGLSREAALQLAAQTVLGAAKMVLTTGEHPAVLKDKVCSPRGTTISGVHALEKSAFRSTIIDAVEAATKRSKEMGNEQ
ncbi:MAG: pyrroline-5-carboxylate reductase [Planctomycetaceae bacterium]|jgi:pyrroline-5-carboxylate reductase|nr:pyrroline-5-carboxylate reductase [Planctomycetaceae bacterium]